MELNLAARKAELDRLAKEFVEETSNMWETWALFREEGEELDQYGYEPSPEWREWIEEVEHIVDLLYLKRKKIYDCLSSVMFRAGGAK